MIFLSTIVSIQSYRSVVKSFIIKTNITLFVVFTSLSWNQTGSLQGLLLTLTRVWPSVFCAVPLGDNYLNWAVQYIVRCTVHIQLVKETEHY